MFTYTEVVERYKAGLLSKAEANKHIDSLNMGSDYRYYPKVV